MAAGRSPVERHGAFCASGFAKLLASALLVTHSFLASAAEPAIWSAGQNIQFVVPSGTGGGTDRSSRIIQKILQDSNPGGATVSVINKPGGGGAVAWSFMHEHAGNTRMLGAIVTSFLTNHILGRSRLTYTDFTPIALLYGDHITLVVNAASPLRTGADLIRRLKDDPQGLTFAVGAAIGNHNHIALGMLMKAAQIDVKKLKTVVFKGSAEAGTALMGGHVDVLVVPTAGASTFAKTGKVRILAVWAQQRLAGSFASIPTWKEQGYPVVFSNWFGVIAPNGLTHSQAAFLTKRFDELTGTQDWKSYLKRYALTEMYLTGEEARDYLRDRNADYKAVLTELGLAN